MNQTHCERQVLSENPNIIINCKTKFQSENSYKIYYHNCSGMRTKIIISYYNKFFVDVKCCNFNIFVLVETWLTDSILDSEIFGSEWLVYRKDCNYSSTGTERGGVLIAIHRSLDSELLDLNTTNNSEQIWTKVKVNNKKTHREW
jgi:hypothetical protein